MKNFSPMSAGVHPNDMQQKGDGIMNRSKSLVIISAPSGCGKDTIIERVCRRLDGVGVSISCTTRPPRPKTDGTYEQHGVEYFFVGRPEFEEGVSRGGFLEHAEKNDELYGTPREYVEKLFAEGKDVVILNIEDQGMREIRKLEPDAVSIFILPPSAQEVRRRLINRKSEPMEKMERRMADNVLQMPTAHEYDYVVLNDDLERAVEDVIHIISAVRCRTMLHRGLIDRVNETFQADKAAHVVNSD